MVTTRTGAREVASSASSASRVFASPLSAVVWAASIDTAGYVLRGTRTKGWRHDDERA
jgi:hypothetical protein